MGRTENQKLKLLYLKELFERQSDEEHLLSMQVRHGYRDGQGPERRVFSCLAHV